ncbi:hypothetical protein [Mucilaginibacter pocheonensis]|uniref:Uncharacterized protein n=1 Tax=Mucilaginibacter pocheonensis TaxID=398050 RepID=A0ABU1TFM8_9SPHI|nr:hypothetical protein [Mucilaginibacter pocheonensis]MDR6944215.1 hypothetical protein [Mucilaginibacter pocheonensis]
MNYLKFKRVWGMPLLLAVLTLFGLLAALLGIGYWNLIAWVTISVPLLVIVQKIWLKRKA